jgi:hypothetical protein
MGNPNAGSTRIKLRLAIARQALAELQDTGLLLSPEDRLERMKLIERLTTGKRTKKAHKHGAFDKE